MSEKAETAWIGVGHYDPETWRYVPGPPDERGGVIVRRLHTRESPQSPWVPVGPPGKAEEQAS